jgi:hypothetical protein
LTREKNDAFGSSMKVIFGWYALIAGFGGAFGFGGGAFGFGGGAFGFATPTSC